MKPEIETGNTVITQRPRSTSEEQQMNLSMNDENTMSRHDRNPHVKNPIAPKPFIYRKTLHYKSG